MPLVCTRLVHPKQTVNRAVIHAPTSIPALSGCHQTDTTAGGMVGLVTRVAVPNSAIFVWRRGHV